MHPHSRNWWQIAVILLAANAGCSNEVPQGNVAPAAGSPPSRITPARFEGAEDDWPTVVRAEVLLLGNEGQDSQHGSFPTPDGRETSILKTIALEGEEARSLAALWQTRIAPACGGFPGLKPVYGLRLYSRDGLELETSFSWEGMGFFAQGSSEEQHWVGFLDAEHEMLQRLRRILPPEPPTSTELAIRLGYRALDNEQFDIAAAEANAALIDEPGNLRLLRLRADIHLAQRQFGLAIDDFTTALNTATRQWRVNLLRTRGETYAQHGEHLLALQDYRDARDYAKSNQLDAGHFRDVWQASEVELSAEDRQQIKGWK